MAFSAHNEMGQNERVETDRCTAPRRHTSLNSESKFIPNPSAQPFVPKWNSSQSDRLNNILSQNAVEISKYNNDKQNLDRPLSMMNGVTSPISPCVPASQHIALRLLSKVLDDETIFSLEEGNPGGETLLPLSVNPGISPSDHWPSPSPHASPDCVTDPDQQLSASIPGEHIWHNTDVNHNNSLPSPITTPTSLPHGRSWVTQSQISPHGTFSMSIGENNSTTMDGVENHPSPQMSSSVESLGNSSYYNPPYSSPTLPDEWTHLSDAEANSCCDIIDQGPYDYSRVSPVHAPVGLVCLSGSWPQKSAVYNEFSLVEKSEFEGNLSNGQCHSWKGSDVPDHQGRRAQFRRSLSCKSDDDSWIGCGKEGLSTGSYCRQTPSNELHVRLDQCYEQLRYLEKERHKAELEICKFWPTRRISSSGSISCGRLPHIPSRVDRLLLDVVKEHAKVEALVARIERIRHSPLNINISESVDEMMGCIRRLQSCRKEEISSLSGRNKQVTGARSTDGKANATTGVDLLSLVSCVRDLAVSTRRCRTAVWCASQLALTEIAKVAVSSNSRRHSSNSESGGVESSLPSPSGGGDS